ncbi:MAG TPA: S8 family serine peptidase [Blastocatellia bacterium]|nr:S8 family serine peptidase [Blastocatellia bacterium]
MRFYLVFACLFTLTTSFLFPLPSTPGYVAALAHADDSEPQELEAFQGYLDPAPRGMDIRYAWTLPGGRGENVRIVDIEYNWNLNHNDLLHVTSDLFIFVKGVNPLPEQVLNEGNKNHGTAVLGELVAAPDGVGVTGIAYRAKLGLINPLTQGSVPDVAGAINRAAAAVRPGDIILLEQQSFAGPRLDLQTGRGLLPIEYEPEVFAAIKAATDKGVIVVESAGNGFENLDHPAYDGAFDRNKRDSGAIIVGAGLPEGGVYGPGPDLTRTAESNYGSCVDVQGWGRFVATTGYGDLRREQGENNWYTDLFGATSGATAMVAGAAAVLQSIIKERGLAPLGPSELRRLLIKTGTPQTSGLGERIGPRPNIRAAIAALDGDVSAPEPKITGIKFKKSGGKLIVDGENFLAGDSIIEIDGQPAPRLKYPSGYVLSNGTTTRIMTKGNVSEMIPPGVEVSITVFTPGTGKRSESFSYRRE